MYAMDKFSALMWLETLYKAQTGNKEELERLTVENQIRTENSQPSVEEELNEFMKGKNPEIKKSIALYQAALYSFSEEEMKLFTLDMSRNNKK